MTNYSTAVIESVEVRVEVLSYSFETAISTAPTTQLRVRNGNGPKGRVLSLSERLLKALAKYPPTQRQDKASHYSLCLFLGKKAG